MTNNSNSYTNHLRILAAFSIWSLFTACAGRQEQPSAARTAAQDTVPVFILQQDTLQKTVELPAELLPYEHADLYAKVQGFVRNMKVDLGDHVKKGQTLAVIEAPEVNSRFAAAEATLQSAKARWASSKDHYGRLYRASMASTPGIVAPADLERSRQQMLADSAAAEAAARQSQAFRVESGYLYVTAPFDGIVTARKADAGTLVGTNAMLLTVQNIRTLRLRVAVPEMYVATTGASREISFRTDAYPEQYFQGKLARKSGAIDPATRTELWEFRVDNDSLLLKAGAFAYVKLRMERGAPSFVVPYSSIATTQERKFVIRVKNGKAAWVDVRQGMTTDSGAEIFGDLRNGDTLLLKASDERKPGDAAYWKVHR